jgi:hypothetical protein
LQSEYKTFSKLTKPIYVNPLSLGFLHQDPAKSSSLGLLPFLFLGDRRDEPLQSTIAMAAPQQGRRRSQARITTARRQESPPVRER